MSDPFLNIDDHLSGIGLVPAPVQVLGRKAKLDNEIARKVLRLDLASFLPPQPEKRGFIRRP